MAPNATHPVVPLTKSDKISQFRDITLDLDLNENQQTDEFLLRWLEARNFDLVEAEKMLRKSLVWRKENDMENIALWEAPAYIANFYQFKICGHDKEGSPVGILPAGVWDVRKLMANGEKPNFIKNNFKLIQEIVDAVTQCNSPSVTSYVMIFDLEGFGMRQLTSIKAIEAILETVKTFESNYPEYLKKAFCVNAPSIFSILFGILKPVMTSRTLSKVEVFGSNSHVWKDVISHHISPAQLPLKYGGTQDKLLFTHSKEPTQ